MVWGKPGRYRGALLCMFDLTVGRPWDASVFQSLKAELWLEFSSKRFIFYPLALLRGKEGWSGWFYDDSFSCCCFLLCLFNSAESPSSSTVRPHSGLRWPNSPLLLSKRPIFVSFERCPSGQRSLSLGCLESSPGETKTEIILNPGQVPPLLSEAKLTPHKMKSNQLVTWEPPWGVLQLDFSHFGHRPKSQWKLRVTGFLCRDAGSSVDLVMF